MRHVRNTLEERVFVFAFISISILFFSASTANAAKLYGNAGNQLFVINTATGMVDKTVPIPNGAGFTTIGRGTLGPDGRTAYFTTSNQSGVVKFDTSSDTFGRFYPILSNRRLNRVGITPDESTMFVVDQDGFVFVVNLSTGSIIAQISIPTQNFDGVMSREGTKFYVPHRDRTFISVISTSSKMVDHTITTASGAHDIVINSDGTRGYVTNELSNSFSCLNLTNDTVINTIPVQSRPIRLDISGDDQRVFVGNRDSQSLSVINASSCSTSSTIPNVVFGASIRDVAFSKDDRRLYVLGLLGATSPIAVYDASTLPISFIKRIDPPAEIQTFFLAQQELIPPPTDLNATVGNAFVSLSWDPVVEPIDSYNVQVKRLNGNTLETVGAFDTSTNFIAFASFFPNNVPVVNGITYIFTITAEKAGTHSAPSETVLAVPNGFAVSPTRPENPILFLHGFNSNASTWDTVRGFLCHTLNWNYGGTLLYRQTDDPQMYAPQVEGDFFVPNADFYIVTFGNSLANYPDDRGLLHQAEEVQGFIRELRNRGVTKKINIMAHSMGGMAARSFIADNPQEAEQRISHYITYGTPHWGASFSSFGQIFSDGARDLDFDCTNGRVDYSDSAFFEHLRNRTLPSQIHYFAIRGHNHAFGHRVELCLSDHWDGIIPIDSADFGTIPLTAPLGQLPLTLNPVGLLETSRFHRNQTSDVAAILYALNPQPSLKVELLSPVDIKITSPNGRSISRQLTEIAGASYYEIEDENDHQTASVLIPFPLSGNYNIQVFPKPSALPTDTFTINLTANGSTTTIAQNMKIQDIPPQGFNVMVNSPPIIRCKNVVVEANSSCTAVISPDDINDGSFDPNPGDTITLGLNTTVLAGLGTHNVTLTATDNHGASSSCVATVTVVDNTPPTISGVSANPSLLWPPNHQLINVTVNYNVTDNCTSSSSIICALSVTSNEPINGTSDGDTAPDWEILGAHQVRLRSERAGIGNGRVYTITITCRDNSGNSSNRSVTVIVPHNRP